MSELSGFRGTVLATDGFEEPCRAPASPSPSSVTPLGSWCRPAWCAGGRRVDREVVEDGNWVTSRQLSDIPAFNRAMLRLFSRSPAASRR
jgi:putative intracellular protease/amidase